MNAYMMIYDTLSVVDEPEIDHDMHDKGMIDLLMK